VSAGLRPADGDTGGRWLDPLCNVFADTYPDAELILLGVEEPLALIHAPNESVDPAEIAAMALTEALFLQRCAAIRS
jgi:cysteinylglycine-S-conjugate dipeptidase